MEKALSRSTKRGLDSMMVSLALAEEYEDWPLFEKLLSYIERSGAGFQYLGFGQYAITYPGSSPQEEPPLEA